MEITLSELIQSLGEGKLEGDPNGVVSGVSSLAQATSKDISFYGSSKYKEELAGTKAGCVFFEQELVQDAALYQGNKIFVNNARWAWTKILRIWEQGLRSSPRGISAKAEIAPSARLGSNVDVGAFSVIEEDVVIAGNTTIYPQCYIGARVAIGSGCIIYPQVTIREGCIIGDRVIIQPGAVIGADGYGFIQVNGKHEKIPQIGIVEIQSDVEIGANCAIDRSNVDRTTIGEGSKFDNLVHIAHNVQIGKHCLLVAQAGIAGSTEVGNGVVVGGQSAIRDNVTIADGVIIGPQAGVTRSVKSGEVLFGTPAIDIKESIKITALARKLPEIYEAVKKLKAQEPAS